MFSEFEKFDSKAIQKLKRAVSSTVIKELESASYRPPSTPVEKDYYNPIAAALLKLAGVEVKLRDGTVLEKSTLEDLNRANTITSPRADEILTLIFDQSSFYRNFTILTHDELTIPMDAYLDVPEQLTSTERIGRQLSNEEQLHLFNVIGQELFLKNVERQYDIPTKIIRNFLYRPDFVGTIDRIIATALANDFLRLATNGYSNTYTLTTGDTLSTASIQSAFYTLKIGHEKLLKTSIGTWTTSNGETVFNGKLGTHRTASKVNIDLLRTIDIFDDDADADNTADYFVDGATISHETSVYRVTASTTGYAQYASMIEVQPFTKYSVTVKAQSKDSGEGKGRLMIIAPDGNTIAMTNEQTDHTTFTSHHITFFSGQHTFINLRLTSTHNSHYVDYKDIKIERDDKSFTGYDIMQIMSEILRNHRNNYKEFDNVFVMSIKDFEKYSEARANPVAFVNGQAIGVNNTMRESWMTLGETPNFRGKRIEINPFKTPIDEITKEGIATSASIYGNIYYGPLEELLIGAQTKIEYTREFNPRSRVGGSAIELTQEFWIDFGVRNYEAFTIAFRGNNAKCETPVISNSNVGKGSQVTTTPTAAAAVYAYCDTPGAEIYYDADASNLADYAKAVADATKVVPNTTITYASTANLHFRAFKDGILLPSSIVELTVT